MKNAQFTPSNSPLAGGEYKPKIIAIVGPTASGKTSLSITLAEKYNGEIVSADSRQIYRGMDIGTAKLPISEREDIPHYLLDIKDPNEEYTVSDYKQDAVTSIEDILKRNKLPILVGGTGLYIDTVIDNLNIPKVKADPELRATIEKDIREIGLAAVFKKLVDRDPEAAYIVDPKNPRRVVRALEVAMLTGEPFTAQRKKNEPLFDALKIGIDLSSGIKRLDIARNFRAKNENLEEGVIGTTPKRDSRFTAENNRESKVIDSRREVYPPPEILHDRINLRIDLMVQDGLVAEVEALVKKYGRTCAAFDAIGYREIIDYLDGKASLEQATDIMKHNTWHYAKRQMTWFRKDKNIKWVKDKEETDRIVKEFLLI
jgi:tRNA dimethylallyltransferase